MASIGRHHSGATHSREVPMRKWLLTSLISVAMFVATAAVVLADSTGPHV
jgi:hypothetical protein